MQTLVYILLQPNYTSESKSELHIKKKVAVIAEIRKNNKTIITTLNTTITWPTILITQLFNTRIVYRNDFLVPKCKSIQMKYLGISFKILLYIVCYQFSFLGVMKLFEYITICIIILSLNITLMLKTWYVLTFCIDNLSNEKCLLSINTSWHLICIWHSTVQFFWSKIKIFCQHL